MEIVLSKILLQIQHQEHKLSYKMMRTLEEALQMTLFLNEVLGNVEIKVLKDGFTNEQQEIDFFKNTKPQILGKLIYYYNKVFRIETTCPVSNGKLHQSYFESLLKDFKLDFKKKICNVDFYRNYRSDTKYRDYIYFRLG